MIGGIVEIAEEGRQLSIYRGFLKVSHEGKELGRVPLDDITALILVGRQSTISRNVLCELAERKAIVIACGTNYHPVSLTWPMDAHGELSRVLYAQINATKPHRSRLWQTIVKAKIRNQMQAVDMASPNHARLKDFAFLIKKVKSGDSDNREAVAARLYWTTLMGKDFKRDKDSVGLNALLNYGYSILRAATARAVCGAGLHPALGIHHRSSRNTFALVDDLMEPFRPVVDLKSKELALAGHTDVSTECKRQLASILQMDLLTERGASPLINCVQYLAVSLAQALDTKSHSLSIPGIRNHLLDLGFDMAQFSVYFRMINGFDAARSLESKIQCHLPASGKINVLTITDKQYERMQTYVGRDYEPAKKQEQLQLF